MTRRRRFPKQLLKESPHTRLQYFLDLTVVHPRLDEAHQTLMRVIRRPFSGMLVFVSGPAGVGKTTLFRKGLSTLPVGHNAVTTELRLAIEQTLRYRRTSHMLIDEAQHFSRIATGRR